MEAEGLKTISIRIDGELVTVRLGQTVLEAARDHGRFIPTLCYLKGLSATGACRVCMVEVAGTDRLMAACTTPAQDGMAIRTTSTRLEEYRKMAIELLLVERNHICSVCVSNGHCELQEVARSLDVTHARYPYNNPRLPVDMSHPRFVLDHNRCVLCTRCVRVCAEFEGAHVWEISARGIGSRLASDMADRWGDAHSCTNCGKCVEVCPTGALTQRGPTACQSKRAGLISELQRKRAPAAQSVATRSAH